MCWRSLSAVWGLGYGNKVAEKDGSRYLQKPGLQLLMQGLVFTIVHGAVYVSTPACYCTIFATAIPMY